MPEERRGSVCAEAERRRSRWHVAGIGDHQEGPAQARQEQVAQAPPPPSADTRVLRGARRLAGHTLPRTRGMLGPLDQQHWPAPYSPSAHCHWRFHD